MTDHPITPPPELVQQWFDIWQGSDDDDVAFADFVAVRASQYGADQELEAIKTIAEDKGISWFAKSLQQQRRPKPPSLKERLKVALQNEDLGKALRLVEQLDD